MSDIKAARTAPRSGCRCQTAAVDQERLFEIKSEIAEAAAVEERLFGYEVSAEVRAKRDSRARAIRRVRNTFRTHPAPTQPMSRPRIAWRQEDLRADVTVQDLVPFRAWFEEQADGRERFRWVLRDSLDELLDGQRTGRWCYQHLSKTEKTYLGTAVEVNLTKEFAVPNGLDLDWHVVGADLDCKFSKDLGGWEIPMEMYRCDAHGDRSGKEDYAALLTWMNDDTSEWAAGLVRTTDASLRWRGGSGGLERAYNRDNKRRLADETAQQIQWLWGGVQNDLPSNLLLQLTSKARAKILTGGSGQQRINQLFRLLPGRLLGRRTILTVAQQDDAPKRARDARIHLRHEGIAVLGHQGSHPQLARALGLPVPVKGEWISVRLVEVDSSSNRPTIKLSGTYWAQARSEEVSSAIPILPKTYP